MTILAICYGTYCDLSSMLYSLNEVVDDIIIVTNVSGMNPQLVKKNVRIETIVDSTTFSKNKDDINKFGSSIFVYSKISVYPKLLKMLDNMNNKIVEVYNANNISAIYAYYHNIVILYTLSYEILTKSRLFILCLAPYYINNKLPYPLSDKNVILGYKENIRDEFTKQIGAFKTLRVYFRHFNAIDDILKSGATYIIAFNRKIAAVLPDKSYYKYAKFAYVNSIIEMHQDKMPRKLVKFCKTPIIFITFGSFSADKPVLMRLLATISDYCVANNIFAIYHNPKIDEEFKRIIKYNGFLSYSAIIPHTRLLVYTGSYCIANIAAYYKVPQLYLPQLYEQYFWANIYYNKTGIPFIDANTAPYSLTPNMINRAITGKRVVKYVERVKDSLDLNAPKRIADLIKK